MIEPPAKVIFIDRDGVINFDPIGDYIKKVEDFRFLDGVLEALQELSRNGYEIVILSNQAGIGDGVYAKEDLDAITGYMLQQMQQAGVRVSGVYYCLHGKKAGCRCRKPEVGLFERAQADVAFDPGSTFFIGDKLSDVEAGKRFGLKTILVLTGHGKLEQPKITAVTRPDFIRQDLREAVELVLTQPPVGGKK